MKSKVLIVVDMQNDFVDGALGFEKAKSIIPCIEKKIKNFDGDIIFTLDTHEKDYLSTQEGINLPIEHCIEGTKGHLLIDDLKPYSKKAIIFKKYTFGSLELANYLKDKNYKEVHIVGLVSNICVLSQAVLAKSALREAKIFVDRECTSSFDDELNAKTLDILESIQIDTKHYD